MSSNHNGRASRILAAPTHSAKNHQEAESIVSVQPIISAIRTVLVDRNAF
jgi:hypothetical protein